LEGINKYLSVQLIIKESNITLKDFIITKMLTKEISEYKVIKNLPYVAVAKRTSLNKNSVG
jgi:DNA polymerase elongation subunit (family B)